MWTPCVKTSLWTPQANCVSYMTPLRVPLGFSTISARLQSLSGSLSRWPTACSGCSVSLFSFFFFLVLFCPQSNTFLLQIIFPLKCGVWSEGLATVIQSLQDVKPGISSLSSPACYNPGGAVERDRHHGHTELSTLRLESLQREAALCCCATGSYQIIFLINLDRKDATQMYRQKIEKLVFFSSFPGHCSLSKPHSHLFPASLEVTFKRNS